MKNLKLSLLLLVALAVPAVAGGIFLGWPLIGGPTYCGSFLNGSCSQTIAAGEAAITGNEVVPADLGPLGSSNAGGQTNGLFSITQLGNGGTLDLTTVATVQTIAANIGAVYVDGSQGSAFTITLPAAPLDGQIVHIVCQVATVGALTVAANTGQSIKFNPNTACVAGTGYSYRYTVANTTWYRY